MAHGPSAWWKVPFMAHSFAWGKEWAALVVFYGLAVK